MEQSRTITSEVPNTNKTTTRSPLQTSADFLRAMSHELRIPLNTILGMAQIMKIKPLNFAEQQDCSKTILESGLDLLALINDIVDFSRSENGALKFHPEDVDLQQLIEQVIRSVNHKAQLKNLQIILRYDEDVPHHIVSDPQRVKQILTNLIDNAIKFTDQGRVLIHVQKEHITTGQTAYLGITITDTGSGISQKQLDQIFTATNATSHHSEIPENPGPELRLGVVKNIVELIGGNIHVASKLGEGSEFRFTLPLLQPSPAKAPDLSPESLSGISALLIDDNELPTQLLQQQLIALGVQTVIIPIANALTTLHALAKDTLSYQIIIMSAQVFDHHIAYLLRTIKANPHLQNIMLGLALSSQPYDYEVENALAEGISCLLNPLQPSNFRQTLINAWKTWTDKGNAPQIPLTAAKKQILLVEDNQLNQKVVKLMLESLGCEIEIAPNGKTAIRLFETKSFDLVFMDLGLPDMHGLEVTAELRQREQNNQRIPIIALTAYTLDEVKQASFKAGVDDYLTKPLLQDKLAAVLETWVTNKK